MSLTRDRALHFAFWSVLASEAVLFAGLLALRAASPIARPSLAATALACSVTISLFVSAGALATAERRMRDGLEHATARLLVVAVLGGFTALALEIVCGRALSASDPASIVLRGLHLAYVSAAIGLSTWSLVLVRCGSIHRRHSKVLSLITSYWYFVGVVWLAVWPFLASTCP